MLQHERDRAKDTGRRREQNPAFGLSVRLFAGLRFLGRQAGEILVRRHRSRSKRDAELLLLRQSDLFDPGWYLASYPDVASAKIDPALHFLVTGWREGRNPSPRFGTTHYLRRNPDVAALDINPLIHFIEHGSFEGREVGGAVEHARSARKDRNPRHDLQPTAEVFQGSFPIPTLSWRRACNLNGNPDAIEVGGLGLAIVATPDDRRDVQWVLDDFTQLSDGGANLLATAPGLGKLPLLADCWFANSNRMVTRWNVAEPTVLRGVQFDPVSGELAMVGEGFAGSSVDPIQFDLASAAMPVLFLSTSAEGELRGIGRLAFPSLARGGFHYPELISASAAGACIDVISTSATYERSLRLLRSKRGMAAIKEIELDLAGATGIEPVFCSDLRQLLERILMIDVVPAADFHPRSGSYLLDAAQLSVPRNVRKNGATLLMAADMVPGLRTLTALAGEGPKSVREARSELIVCDVDPAQPSVSFGLPAGQPQTPGLLSQSYPLPFPVLRNGAGHCGPLAIRKSVGPIDDAEYLVPDQSLQADEAVEQQSLCWLVDWSGEDELLLAQSLTALGLQRGIGEQQLCFLRPPGALVRTVAESEFAGRWTTIRDAEEALATTDAGLVAYLGEGAVLHDKRTAALLATMLLDPQVTSASCAIISSFRHGKSWRPTLLDEGHLPVDTRLTLAGVRPSPAEMIWRATYAVSSPSSHLWVARTDCVRRWIGNEKTGDELHLLTSNITASVEFRGKGQGKHCPIPIRPASEDRSIRLQALVG